MPPLESGDCYGGGREEERREEGWASFSPSLQCYCLRAGEISGESPPPFDLSPPFSGREGNFYELRHTCAAARKGTNFYFFRPTFVFPSLGFATTAFSRLFSTVLLLSSSPPPPANITPPPLPSPLSLKLASHDPRTSASQKKMIFFLQQRVRRKRGDPGTSSDSCCCRGSRSSLSILLLLLLFLTWIEGGGEFRQPFYRVSEEEKKIFPLF